MQQITIISGKGGTGKTSFTSAFASLARKAVFADCDVDAADLYLTLQPENVTEEVFPGSYTARIDPGVCTQCGICREHCRFDAITEKENLFVVSPFSCEGCGFCKLVCPEEAISMEQSNKSRWLVGETRFGPMVYATLGVAEDLSGKLVTLVRDKARALAKEHHKNLIIADGPPGVGCPVIASITGADKVVVITEPTLSGIHDLKRVVELADGFGTKISVVINKHDINPEMAKEIESFCRQNNLMLAGMIPFDAMMVEAMVNQKTITEYAPGSDLAEELKRIWTRIEKM
jgi:MinD superfamily P-loop ATPase